LPVVLSSPIHDLSSLSDALSVHETGHMRLITDGVSL
jgi:hypothetical protein